ncbi:MAG: ferrous iron transport protein A [Clostridia bacterium]|nr:ferrous iron transport protein A [Clostridia bacterium]
MMPLCFASPGEEQIVKKVGGSPEIRKHLEDLGFTVGATVTVISALGENVIVRIKDSRLAINADMAKRIMI